MLSPVSGVAESTRATVWLGSLLAFASVGVTAALSPLDDVVWGSPQLFLWAAAPAAFLCALGGLAVVLVGLRQSVPEITLLGGAITTLALLVLTHVLSSHGSGWHLTEAFHISGALTLPLGLAVAAPLAAPGIRWARAVGRVHGAWVCAWMAVTVIVCAALLVDPQASWSTAVPRLVWVVLVFAGAALAIRIALRQLTLHRISRRPAALVSSVALAEMGVASALRLITSAYSPAWWVLALFDVLASLMLIVAVSLGYRTSGGLRGLLAPVVARDPLTAMELGFSPIVHTYVSALERKDQITRDHVVRVAELAIRAGERLGLAPDRLHWLGVGALLHDIGKLAIPDAVLGKPGALSDAEMVVMRTHAELGGHLVAAEPALAPAAWIVRGHHERYDGRGYPDGLPGGSVPIEAAIVSVSDAYDAMAHTRQYRVGLGRERAVAVLREHSGSQWDPVAVQAVLDAVPELASEPVFAGVGEGAPEHDSCFRDWFSDSGDTASLGSP